MSRKKKRKNKFPKEDFRLDPHWCLADGEDNSCCVLMLAGRSQRQNLLPSIYWQNGMHGYKLAGIQTFAKAWYPAPNGMHDQRRAVAGIPHAIKLIEYAVEFIGNKFNIPKSRIVLLGFSAGGVMALQAAAHSEEPYAGVVCQSGAILDPETFPISRHDTPILLTHCQDDDTFDWLERYLPMKSTLIDNGYNLTIVESPTGGHSITGIDLAVAKLFIKRCLS